MKKLILILILLSTLPLFGQVRLSTMDSITTFGIYDYSYWNALSGGTYLNRKVSWTALRAAMIDYIDGLANTWALKQTFSSGATFSAGANGTVSFADSVLMPSGSSLWVHWIQRSAVSSIIGNYNAPFFTIYAQHFTTTNLEGNDSCVISYDDSTLTFDKGVSFSGDVAFAADVSFDSSFVFKSFTVGVYTYPIGNIADSILILMDTCSTIKFALPGNVTNMEKITFQASLGSGKGAGTIIKLINTDASDVITLKDNAADGNLQLAGDFAMGTYDYIELQYINNSGTWVWAETKRSNN